MNLARISGTAAALLFGTLFVGTTSPVYAQHDGQGDKQEKGGGQPQRQQAQPQGRPAQQQERQPQQAQPQRAQQPQQQRPEQRPAQAQQPQQAQPQRAQQPQQQQPSQRAQEQQQPRTQQPQQTQPQQRAQQPQQQAQPQRAQQQPQQTQPQRAQQPQQQQPQRAQQQQPPQPSQRVQQQPAERGQQPQQAQARGQQPPQRSQQQAQVWQEQRGWQHGGASQGHATFQQDRAQHWSSEHRTWAQRGGYGGFYIPQDRFGLYFGSQHFFRIGILPTMYLGYPEFQYGGFSFLMVDPYPEYWADNWYNTDDVYIDYDDGYYLYDRRYPDVRLAVSIQL